MFFGKVLSKGDNQLAVRKANDSDQTVFIGADTKLVNRKMETITLNDIQINDRVRIKGVRDRDEKTIRETDQVKDLSLPVKVQPSTTPTESE